MAKRKADFKIILRIIPYFAGEKRLFLIGFASMLFVSIANILDPLIIGHVIDKVIPDKDISHLFLFAGLFVLVIVTAGILTYIQTIVMSRLGVSIITRLKKDLYEHMLKLPISYFDKNPVGALMSRVESDSENVMQLFSSFSIIIIGNFIFFFAMVAVLMFKNPSVTLRIMIPIPILFTAALLMINYLKKYFKRVRELNAEIIAVLTEYIQGISIVQLFNREMMAQNILDMKSKKKFIVERNAAFIEYSFWSLYGFSIEILFIVLVIILLAPKVIAGIMTIGTLVIFLQYGRRIFEPLIQISENLNMIQRSLVSLTRIFSILDIEDESVSFTDRKSPQFNHSIVFENVSFEYKKSEPVLNNINIEIKKNQKIALVGASGSGKTTTVLLLCGFYHPTKGRILIDGIDLKTMNIYEWRKKIGLVMQDIFMFPGNILENVRIYDDKIDEERVMSALKKVQIDETVLRGDGIFRELSERAQNISTGERQLLSFARAIVFSPELIVLDEATSSVDPRTERRIRDAMDDMLKDRTSLIVAHRLSTVLNADKIYLFQDGEIISEGDHLRLMEKSPEYTKLVNLQFLSGKENEDR
jgi:ABC-type multidrug transport system fused ATPase/permease subunit